MRGYHCQFLVCKNFVALACSSEPLCTVLCLLFVANHLMIVSGHSCSFNNYNYHGVKKSVFILYYELYYLLLFFNIKLCVNYLLAWFTSLKLLASLQGSCSCCFILLLYSWHLESLKISENSHLGARAVNLLDMVCG